MFFRRKKAAPEPPATSPSEGLGAKGVPGEPGTGAASGPPSTQFLTGDQTADRDTVQVLLDTIAKVSESQDLDSLLIDIVDRSIEITGAERGLLLMAGPDGELGVRVAREITREGPRTLDEELRFSTSIARRVQDQCEAVRATVQSESEALELGRSVYDLKLRAVMCVPLTQIAREGSPGNSTTGVLYVDSRAATRQFSQRDLGLFAALAQHISIALDNALKKQMEKSLELAKVIQHDLMPRIPSDVEGYDLHGWYRPAEEAAGDFFDFVRAKDGGMTIVVGDATGHGIGPALITATAQAGLRSYLRLVADPGEVVSLLNQDLCERVEDGRFLTLFLGQLGADGSLRAVNAGHEPPLLWRRDGDSFETLSRGGPALGMIDDETYLVLEPVKMESGDVLIAFSDGLTESRDPKLPEGLFGLEGVQSVVREAAMGGATAKEIALAIVDAALRHAKGVQEDDVTLVVVRRV